ncbi:hypothetical protein FOIG_09254 [Fusarium odoratissimum NRRL 54006]|uniref:Uncharacterized protein n=1 Tax=Fusarium odoratissimum (strain NRRL 54006) TaxID=1089451 RepID=X0JQ56_FUSO5|nr:uncharacterized protein FOIG_09254 [Fusarium odoratissimum NRRL 54006]EXL98470.1 hypothetical protein FOIG_09254 [Fusarium odoratissimum NRRL 54006]
MDRVDPRGTNISVLSCNVNQDSGTPSNTGNSSTEVDIGEVEDDAAQWWSAVLSNDGSWDSTIQEARMASHCILRARSRGAVRTPTSSAAARGYWSDYCSLHEIEDQKLVALMDALLIPVAKYDGRSIELSRPVLSYGKGRRESSRSRPYRMDKSQFDKLLTLGCNPRGIKALLGSVFYEPNVECNICGIWLQGSFALLNQFNDDNALSRTLIRRDPDIGALWVGAFMTGAHHQCLQRAQAAWWNIDLKVAAWTDTPMSFIQEPISAFSGLKLKFLVQTNAGSIPEPWQFLYQPPHCCLSTIWIHKAD